MRRRPHTLAYVRCWSRARSHKDAQDATVRASARVAACTYTSVRAPVGAHMAPSAPTFAYMRTVGEYVHVRRRTYGATACSLVGVRVPTPPNASAFAHMRIQARTPGTTPVRACTRRRTYNRAVRWRRHAHAHRRATVCTPAYADACPYAIGREAYLPMLPGWRTCARVRHHTRMCACGIAQITRTYAAVRAYCRKPMCTYTALRTSVGAHTPLSACSPPSARALMCVAARRAPSRVRSWAYVCPHAPALAYVRV